MGSTAEFRVAFVARLQQACDEAEDVPPPHKGRQQYLADSLGVAPEAVSKWFKARSMPRPDKLERLAELLKVEQTWLAFGVSPEMDRSQRKKHSREVSGAVHLVMGMIMLSGGHCGVPSDKDQRADYVDLYATLQGSVYPVHVCLARELANEFEVALPKEFRDVRCIAVVPNGPDRYHFLDMDTEMIEAHKTRRSGSFIITFKRGDQGTYSTEGSAWARIRHFRGLR